MPVYEYQCTVCRKEFEYEHRMSDPPKTVCEACGGALERLISRTSFAFKGGGWYKDLYASAKPSGDASPSSTPSTETKKADSGSSSGGSSGGSADSGGSSSGGTGSSGGSSSGGSSSGGSSTPAAS